MCVLLCVSASQKPLRAFQASGSCSQRCRPTASAPTVGGGRCTTQVGWPQPRWPLSPSTARAELSEVVEVKAALTLTQTLTQTLTLRRSCLQGWSFSCRTCTTRRLWLPPPLAPLLRATSTGSFRGGCWPSASPSPAASDVTLHPHVNPPPEGQSRPKASVFLPAGPSSCEEERRAAAEALGAFVPSCEPGGGFSSRQCQQGGQCWCVDPTGQELPGSRQRGDSLDCSECPAAGGGPVLLPR